MQWNDYTCLLGPSRLELCFLKGQNSRRTTTFSILKSNMGKIWRKKISMWQILKKKCRRHAARWKIMSVWCTLTVYSLNAFLIATVFFIALSWNIIQTYKRDCTNVREESILIRSPSCFFKSIFRILLWYYEDVNSYCTPETEESFPTLGCSL